MNNKVKLNIKKNLSLRPDLSGLSLTGFTLIELIQVIVIIGILAVIAFPKFLNFRDDAQAARDQGILSALRSAIYLYYVQNATQQSIDPEYPPDINTLIGLVRWDPPSLPCSYNWTVNGTPVTPTCCPNSC